MPEPKTFADLCEAADDWVLSVPIDKGVRPHGMTLTRELLRHAKGLDARMAAAEALVLRMMARRAVGGAGKYRCGCCGAEDDTPDILHTSECNARGFMRPRMLEWAKQNGWTFGEAPYRWGNDRATAWTISAPDGRQWSEFEPDYERSVSGRDAIDAMLVAAITAAAK